MIGKVPNPIRVLIVDDSAFMKRVLQDIFSSDPEIEVVGLARNGKEALEVAKRVKPDVITLDVEMPIMDGLTCLKLLMEQGPYAVIMISSTTDEGAKATIQALEIGAVDFVKKPSNLFLLSSEEKKRMLIEKVKIAKNAVLKDFPKNADILRKLFIGKKAQNIEKIIMVGTSTGGPRALQNVIPYLPGDLPAAVIVVQHMPRGFTRSLAMRLNDISEMTVKEAEDGETVQAGFTYIAPGDKHLLVVKNQRELILRLDDSDPVSGHRPSYNKTLSSVVDTEITNLIGVIMTGMGSDGSIGLKELKEKRNMKIIAQDEKSCVVYGMPRVVAEMGIADKIVPLQQIPEVILNFMGVHR